MDKGKIFYLLSAIFNIETSEEFNLGVYSVNGLNELSVDNISAYVAGSKYVLVAEQVKTATQLASRAY